MTSQAYAPLGLFTGERAVVTGSASSIGRGIAVALAREGAEVLLVDVAERANRETASIIQESGGQARAHTADLSVTDGWKAVLVALGDRVPEMFVHSASPPRHEMDHAAVTGEAVWDGMVNTNLRSGFFLGQALAQRMAAADVPGRLLYLTSLHAETPRNLPHYSASKAGMTMVVKELARAFGPSGIRVNALAPGAVPGGGAKSITDEFRAKIPMRRVGTPADMAATALALLSDRFTPYVTGTTVAVDGGLALYNWIPFTEA